MSQTFNDVLMEGENPAVLVESYPKTPAHLFYKPGREKAALNLLVEMGLIVVTKYPIPVANSPEK